MSLKLEIKYFYASDIEDICNWVPEDKSDVYYGLLIIVGEFGKKEGTDFQISIATPKGISNIPELINHGIYSDRNLLLVSDYSWEVVEKRLKEIVSKCTASNFGESMLRLQRYFLWEYEDWD